MVDERAVELGRGAMRDQDPREPIRDALPGRGDAHDDPVGAGLVLEHGREQVAALQAHLLRKSDTLRISRREAG